MPPTVKLARNDHFAANSLVVFLKYLKTDQPVVYENITANFNPSCEIGVVDADLANIFRQWRIRRDDEIEELADFEHDWLFDHSGANLRSLDIHHDGKGALDLFADTSNATANLTHIVVVRMSHVDATHIDKVNRHQSLENFFAIGRRTDGEDDLCPSCSSWWIVSHSN